MAKYVRKGPVRPRKSLLLVILNILIGIVLAAIAILYVTFPLRTGDSYYNRKFDENYVYRSIERHRYADVVEEYYTDWGILGEIKKGSEEAAAVADYADAAFRLSMCEMAKDEKGTDMTGNDRADQAAADAASGSAVLSDAQLADHLRERMQSDREKMGIYLPEADRIDEILSR